MFFIKYFKRKREERELRKFFNLETDYCYNLEKVNQSGNTHIIGRKTYKTQLITIKIVLKYTGKLSLNADKMTEYFIHNVQYYDFYCATNLANVNFVKVRHLKKKGNIQNILFEFKFVKNTKLSNIAQFKYLKSFIENLEGFVNLQEY